MYYFNFLYKKNILKIVVIHSFIQYQPTTSLMGIFFLEQLPRVSTAKSIRGFLSCCLLGFWSFLEGLMIAFSLFKNNNLIQDDLI
jgi:hypothetical protein